MDKSTRALYASADNAAEIDALRAELKRSSGIGGSEIKIRMVDGLRSGINTSFGEITSKTCAGVIIAYTGTSSVLLFRGNEVKSGTSPIFAVFGKVNGELTLRGNCSNGRAFIIEM